MCLIKKNRLLVLHGQSSQQTMIELAANEIFSMNWNMSILSSDDLVFQVNVKVSWFDALPKKISLLVLHGPWSLQTKTQHNATLFFTRNSKMVLSTYEMFFFVVNQTFLWFDALDKKNRLLVLLGQSSLQTMIELSVKDFFSMSSNMALLLFDNLVFEVNMIVSWFDVLDS